MRILIIGGSSTAGAYFAHYCMKNKGIEVIIANRRNNYEKCFLPYEYYQVKSKRYEYENVLLDINQSVGEIYEIIKKVEPTHIVSFSSLCMVGQSWDDPDDWYQTNVIGQSHLIQALAQYKGLKHYIHFSTPEVYGSTIEAVKENEKFNPTTPYAASRAAGDYMTKLWSIKHEIPTTITRASSIYSEGQHLYRIIPRALMCGLYNKVIYLEGNGSSIRYYLHMEDVSRALLMLAEKDISNIETYHISSSRKITIRELLMICLGKYKKGLSTSNVRYVQERPGLDHAYHLDDSKLRGMGWCDNIELEDGIDRVKSWLESIPEIQPEWLSYKHKA